MDAHEEVVVLFGAIWEWKKYLEKRIEHMKKGKLPVPRSLQKNLSLITQAEEVALASESVIPWEAFKAIGATDEVIKALTNMSLRLANETREMHAFLDRVKENHVP